MKALKINNQFILSRKLAQGSFGYVMLGLDQNTGSQVAIKVEKEENEHIKTLNREVEILERLKGVEGIPKVLYHGQENSLNVIVYQLLQKDLSSLIKKQKRFSLKTVLQIGIQVVSILERIHKKGVLHRDVKPDNIMIDENNTFYLIDYGISKIYLRRNGTIQPFKDRLPFIGTTRYAATAAHKGYELGRKDDIESLIYVLLYFYYGQLPWQNQNKLPHEQKTKLIGDLKLKECQKLLKDLPKELGTIYDYLLKLNYANEPDYENIIRLFKKAATNQKIELDIIYDWDNQTTTQTEVFSRFATLPPEEINFQEQRSTNIFQVQTPSRRNRQRQVGTTFKGSVQNFSHYKDTQKSSMLNSFGAFHNVSIGELSEETEYTIPEENLEQQLLIISKLPSKLKKPGENQFDNDDVESLLSNTKYLSEKVDKLKQYSIQITSIPHNLKQ